MLLTFKDLQQKKFTIEVKPSATVCLTTLAAVDQWLTGSLLDLGSKAEHSRTRETSSRGSEVDLLRYFSVHRSGLYVQARSCKMIKPWSPTRSKKRISLYVWSRRSFHSIRILMIGSTSSFYTRQTVYPYTR